ncbi:unnamed protein product [Adineta steineri]|uniref:NADP-dependent oxidoreductase domain-containing protein n=1 Tax=Adineta steineri TaxID=433720 RepID=A0A815TCY5_9BILA|nr:unnamed protein product [Adineta steineri]CAF1645098.1 unnamed protein product [Adineta steineri]
MTPITIANALASTVTLNDGTVMPMFGLGVYRIDNNCRHEYLESNYVDLYMIHAPKDHHCADAYQALLDAKKQGKIK